MLRLVLSLVALVGLAACGADHTWAPDAAVEAARYSPPDEPPSITLYTVINKSTGAGAHSAILVNGSERVMFDPAGTWYHPKLPFRYDTHYGMTDKAVAFYIDYHARETYDVLEQKIVVSPEVAQRVLHMVESHAPVGKSMCAEATSSLLREVPGFQSIKATWFPKKLADEFASLPGVSSRLITDDDDDSNHGVLILQANGDPLE